MVLAARRLAARARRLAAQARRSAAHRLVAVFLSAARRLVARRLVARRLTARLGSDSHGWLLALPGLGNHLCRLAYRRGRGQGLLLVAQARWLVAQARRLVARRWACPSAQAQRSVVLARRLVAQQCYLVALAQQCYLVALARVNRQVLLVVAALLIVVALLEIWRRAVVLVV